MQDSNNSNRTWSEMTPVSRWVHWRGVIKQPHCLSRDSAVVALRSPFAITTTTDRSCVWVNYQPCVVQLGSARHRLRYLHVKTTSHDRHLVSACVANTCKQAGTALQTPKTNPPFGGTKTSEWLFSKEALTPSKPSFSSTFAQPAATGWKINKDMNTFKELCLMWNDTATAVSWALDLGAKVSSLTQCHWQDVNKSNRALIAASARLWRNNYKATQHSTASFLCSRL